MITRKLRRFAAALGAALTMAGALAAARTQSSPPADQLRTFEGSWSAVGRRRTLPTEGERPATVVELSGAVVLATGMGLSRGFLGEAIGFDDGRSLGAGRAVWTDARGDRVYSVLRGGAPQAGRRTAGEITGGTGAYTGITGAYELTWQYVAEGEDNAVQGRATNLKGTFRLGDVQR
jgi:hypothetical protein